MKINSSINNKQHVSFTDAINFIRHAPMDEVTGFLHMLPAALRAREGTRVEVVEHEHSKCEACGQGFTKTGRRQKYCKRAVCQSERAAAYQRAHYHSAKRTSRIRPNGDAHAMPTMQETASAVSA